MRLSAVVLAVAVVAAAAAVFAGVPHTFMTNETLAAADLNNDLSALDQRLAALESAKTPPGTIVAYGGPAKAPADAGAPSLPDGWLLCDGSAVSRTTYAALFAAIGINFGGGDGLATFNLPDLRGRFPRGTDHGAGRDTDAANRLVSNPGGHAGDVVGSIEADSFASHGHGVNDPGHVHSLGSQTFGLTGLGSSGLYVFGVNGAIPNNPTTNASATGITIGASGGGETRPKNLNVDFIIKI
jgi:microcystin-dependent protein